MSGSLAYTVSAAVRAQNFEAEWAAAAQAGTIPPRLGVLFTYAHSQPTVRRLLAEAARRELPVILDSGAWSVFNAGASIDRAAHAAFVREAQELWPNTRFLALDVIGDDSATFQNWVAQRNLGARVEPTIHFGAEPRSVRAYVEANSLAPMPDGRAWINVGGLVAGQGNPTMHRKMAAWSAAVRREVDKVDDSVRIHGLGTTAPAVNDLVRYDGVDSSYWLTSLVRFRMLPLFDPARRKWAKMLLAMTKPEYERESRTQLHKVARLLRSHYGTTPSEVWEMDDDARLALSLRSHAYFAEAYRMRHRRIDAPTVYLAGKPTRDTEPIWDDIARWSRSTAS